mgnify:CR=1 FL=1
MIRNVPLYFLSFLIFLDGYWCCFLRGESGSCACLAVALVVCVNDGRLYDGAAAEACGVGADAHGEADAVTVEATPLVCVICLEGDGDERVLFAQCCDQPLHAKCLKQHVAARAYQDPASDEEVATLTRARVRCPACNVVLRSTSTKRALRETPSDVVVHGAEAVEDAPPSPPGEELNWLEYTRHGGRLTD